MSKYQPYTPKRKFYAHRCNARRRGIEFILTFEEWFQIWQDSGYWDQRGLGKNQYVMSRYGDQGPYSITNVFIQMNCDNVREYAIKFKSEATKKKMSLAKIGVPKSEEHKRNMSIAIKKLKSK
jgi:hypothetical protein